MRFLPRARAARVLTIVAVLAVYSLLMWWFVFPWVDRTWVNRPAFDEGTPIVPAVSSTPTPTGIVSPP